MSPAGGAGAVPIAGGRAEARPVRVPMPAALAARVAIAQVSASPESTSPGYEDHHEPDISDGFPDGWEGDEPDPARPIDDEIDDATPANQARRPIIEFFTDARGELGYRVAARHPAVQAQLGQFGSETSFREWRHDRLAQLLIDTQPEAIAANGPHQAYNLLVPMTQTAIADRVTRSEKPGASTWISRNRDELIGCPWGTVPLDFFTWGIEEQKAKEYQQLLDIVHSDHTGASAASLARAALGNDVDPSTVERLRKLVPLASELHQQGFRVEALRRSCVRWHDAAVKPYVPAGAAGGEADRRPGTANGAQNDDDDANDERLHRLLRGRGTELYRFAIAGWEPEGGDRWFLSR